MTLKHKNNVKIKSVVDSFDFDIDQFYLVIVCMNIAYDC